MNVWYLPAECGSTACYRRVCVFLHVLAAHSHRESAAHTHTRIRSYFQFAPTAVQVRVSAAARCCLSIKFKQHATHACSAGFCACEFRLRSTTTTHPTQHNKQWPLGRRRHTHTCDSALRRSAQCLRHRIMIAMRCSAGALHCPRAAC